MLNSNQRWVGELHTIQSQFQQNKYSENQKHTPFLKFSASAKQRCSTIAAVFLQQMRIPHFPHIRMTENAISQLCFAKLISTLAVYTMQVRNGDGPTEQYSGEMSSLITSFPPFSLFSSSLAGILATILAADCLSSSRVRESLTAWKKGMLYLTLETGD